MEAWGPLILTYNIYYTVRIRVFVRNLSVKSNLNIKRNYFKIFLYLLQYFINETSIYSSPNCLITSIKI